MQIPENWATRKRFFIGDTETTGLRNKRACEVGLLEIDPVTLDPIWSINSLIDPEQPIEAEAAAIHGITNEMVANEPTMAEFVAHPKYLNGGLKGEITIICHNVPFDLPLLEPIGAITRTVCTLAEARFIKSRLGVSDCKLQTLRQHFGIAANNAHRALDDCEITRLVLKAMLPIIGRSLDELADASNRTVHIMPWGEHEGKPLHEVPGGYLRWMAGLEDLDKNLKKSVKAVLALK